MEIIYSRSINLILFLILATFFITGCDSKVNLTDEQYISNAKDYWDKKQVKETLIELKNALQQNPKNAEARWLLGNLYVEVGQGAGAEKELKKALELGISDSALYTLLLKSLMLQGKYDDLLDIATPSNLSQDHRAEALSLRGYALLSQNKTDDAYKQFTNALNKSPDSKFALAGMASLKTKTGNIKDADKLLKKALKIDPEYATAWSLLGDIEIKKQQADSAEKYFTKAIKLKLNNYSDIYKRALARVQLKKYELAEKDIQRLIKNSPDSPYGSYAQGILFFSKQQYQEAQVAFEKTLQINPNHLASVFYLGTTHLAQKHNEQANEYLQRLVNNSYDYLPARKLLSIVKLRNKQFREAETLIRPAYTKQPNDIVTLNILANALLYQGKPKEAISIYEKIIKLDPDNAESRSRLGLSLLVDGNIESSTQSFEKAIKLNPDFDKAERLLIISYVKAGMFDKAIVIANKYKSKYPDQAYPYNFLGDIYQKMREFDKSKSAFEKAKSISPANPEANHNLAYLAIKDKKYDSARNYYLSVLKVHKDNLGTLILLAALNAIDNKNDKMVATLERAISAHPKSLEPRLTLGRYYLKLNQPRKTLTLSKVIQDKFGSNPDLLSLIGESQISINQPDNAKSTFIKLVEVVPNSSQAHYLLAATYGKLNNKNLMKSELIKALNLNPSHVLARSSLTGALIHENNYTEASKHIDYLKKQLNNPPRVMELEADLQMARNLPEKAAVLYKKAYEQAKDKHFIIKLAFAKLKMGDNASTKETLKIIEKDYSKDKDSLLIIGQAYMQMGMKQDATDIYTKLLNIDPNNTFALNNLAWLLTKSDLDKSLSLIEKASEKAPNNISVMDTHAMILLEKGELNRASRLIDRILSKNPDNPSILYHKAIILEKKSNKEQARAILEKILSKHTQFEGREEAQAMLKSFN